MVEHPSRSLYQPGLCITILQIQQATTLMAKMVPQVGEIVGEKIIILAININSFGNKTRKHGQTP